MRTGRAPPRGTMYGRVRTRRRATSISAGAWRGLEGLARGTIGWPKYPAPEPSRLDFTTSRRPGYWFQPRWEEVWFPDAFAGPMAQLLCALESGEEPEISGEDNLKTMALVDACYLSAEEKRAVEISEVMT